MNIASELVGVWRLVAYADEQEGREDTFTRRTDLYRPN
jgi:hypothetical protein